ncbi:uncharacterized protein Dere_GG12878, partial [Drosophila erecta]
IMANADSHERGNTYLAHDGAVQLPTGTDSVYLVNPSMNELMRAIHSASSMDSLKRVIVSRRSATRSFPFPRTSHLLPPTSFRMRKSGSSCHQSAGLTRSVLHRRRSFDHQLHQQRVNVSAQRLWKVHSEGNLLGPRKPNQSDSSVNLCECAEMISRELSTEVFRPALPLNRGNLCYWISWAHLVMVISCLRGLL